MGRWGARPPGFFLKLYAGSELAIGISGLVVAPALGWGRALLSTRVEHAAWGSAGYYLASGGWIALVLLPFCTAMGATFPLAMAGIRAAFEQESRRSFSYLYVANVLGAMAGALGSAFVFIEWMGFSRTLLVATAVNGLIAALAWTLGRGMTASASPLERPAAATGSVDRIALPLLFCSGLSSLAMEVVWTRQFVPFLGPVVYSFATMLAVYLAATAAGSRVYRAFTRRSKTAGRGYHRQAAILAGSLALLPLWAADPRIPNRHRLAMGALRVAWAIAPFCGVLGFLTPMLVDRWSGESPEGRPGLRGECPGMHCGSAALRLSAAAFRRGAPDPGSAGGAVFRLRLDTGPESGAAGAFRRPGGGGRGGVARAGDSDARLRDALPGGRGAERPHGHGDRHGPGDGAHAAGERGRHHQSHSDHQDDGASAAQFARVAARARAGAVLRDGDFVPLGDESGACR